MNLSPTNPPLTPPRRGTGRRVLLPSWEGLSLVIMSGAPPGGVTPVKLPLASY